jgi:hypothetical protein
VILNGTRLLLVYGEVTILQKNLNTTKTNTGTLSNAIEVGLEVNKEKTKFLLMSHYPNAGQNHNIR